MPDQFKLTSQLMKNMSPGEMKELMEQARNHQRQLTDQIRKIVEEEINKRNLVSRDEVRKILNENA